MIDAINGLTVLQFILLVLAVFTALTQLALLGALAIHVNRIRVWWGLAAVIFWIAFFVATR